MGDALAERMSRRKRVRKGEEREGKEGRETAAGNARRRPVIKMHFSSRTVEWWAMEGGREGGERDKMGEGREEKTMSKTAANEMGNGLHHHAFNKFP